MKGFVKIARRMTFLVVCAFASQMLFSMDPPDIKFNPWELIIYRPENKGAMNDVRCWLLILDEDGNDVTYSCAKATYEWVSIPGKANYYRKKWYLSGGMAIHLNIKKGKYKIKVYTPKDQQNGVKISARSDGQMEEGNWVSNEFNYDTENPLKVLFVSPTANQNGFYDGGWFIDYWAPEFYKWTKPYVR